MARRINGQLQMPDTVRTDYDRMLDALAVTKAQAGVKDTSTAFGRLPDMAEKRLEEIPKPVGN